MHLEDVLAKPRRTRITDRDKALLIDLFRVRAMTEKDITETYFNASPSGTSRRLRRLEMRGLVTRTFMNQHEHGVGVQLGKYVTLGREGIKWVREELGLSVADIHEDRNDPELYLPKKQLVGKYVFAASVYAWQVEELEAAGWEWLPHYMVKDMYDRDLRYPGIGYLCHKHMKVMVPLFVGIAKRKRGLATQVERILQVFQSVMNEGAILGDYVVPYSVLIVPDDQWTIAMERSRLFARTVYRLMSVTQARDHLCHLLTHKDFAGIRNEERFVRFERLIPRAGEMHYYVNLSTFNPTTFWQIVSYDHKTAFEEAEQFRRPLRGVTIVVQDDTWCAYLKNQLYHHPHVEIGREVPNHA